MRTTKQLGHWQREFLRYLGNQEKPARISEFVQTRVTRESDRKNKANIYRAARHLVRRGLAVQEVNFGEYQITELGRKAVKRLSVNRFA